MWGNQNKAKKIRLGNLGFTLIELMVVISIIVLLASVILVSMISSREKARNVKRLGDITQMNTALELYFAKYRGYPTDTGPVDGIPDGLTEFATSIPRAPMPPDGICNGLTHTGAAFTPPNGTLVNQYYYIPTGNSFTVNGVTVWSDYRYYFCLGKKTGNFDEGVRYMTPSGVK